MRLLIDIGHPAHIHLFRNFAHEMIKRGHDVLFTCKEKEFEVQLLQHYNLPFHSFGKKKRTIIGKLLGIFSFGYYEIKTGYKFKPDIFLSHGSYSAAHASFFLKKPHISFEDTFNPEQVILYKPFTSAILTSDYPHPLRSEKVIKYKGYNELAYLHPKWYTPDNSIFKELGIDSDQPYVLLRFVSWNASHDIGHKGLNLRDKVRIIDSFKNIARVFISSEDALPEELIQYKITINPYRIHDVLAFASLYFGESSTMAEEAALLGTPSIYINTRGTFYTKHLEVDYGLLYNFAEDFAAVEDALKKGMEILDNKDYKKEWQNKSRRLLNDCIDVTSFQIWFVENWPASFRQMKEQPSIQFNFR